MATQLEAARTFLADLLARRDSGRVGHNPARLLELHGATVVEPTAFEPDPVTHRAEHYYNAVENVLYRRVWVRRERATGAAVAYWKAISDA